MFVYYDFQSQFHREKRPVARVRRATLTAVAATQLAYPANVTTNPVSVAAAEKVWQCTRNGLCSKEEAHELQL